MAFFKFRKGGDAPASPPPESVEAMRRRARVRLTGAAVLVLAGVIGFPLLFDTQPRPVAVDIPIEIPDRNKVKPLAAPAAAVAQAPADTVGAAAPAPAPVAAPAEPVTDPAPPPEAPRSDTAVDVKPDPKAAAAAKSKPESKPEPKPDTKAAKAPARSEADAARAKALLEGRAVPPAAKPAAAAAAPGEGRFVVQIGAFADAAKAQDTRQKVEKSGLKTYTLVAETKEGKRTRVRVGPFATRSEADKAAEKIKGLDLPAAVLTL